MKSRTWLWIGLLIVVLVAAGALWWFVYRPQAAETGCTTVQVFDLANYATGPRACLPIDEYKKDDLANAGLLDNSITSIKVASGFVAIGYDRDNFSIEGPAIELKADVPDLDRMSGGGLNEWDNVISSIKVQKAPACNVTLYSETNFVDTADTVSACFEPGTYTKEDLFRKRLINGSFGFPGGLVISDPITSSIKIADKFKVTVYDRTGDNSQEFTTDIKNLGQIRTPPLSGLSGTWNDRIMSIRVETAPACGVAVYGGANYDGDGACLPVGNYTTAALEAKNVPNNTIASIKVNTGFKATVYKDDEFKGNSFEFIASAVNLDLVPGGGETRWDDRISSIKVVATTPAGELTFTASPTTIASGGSAKLIWANAANNCTATGWTFDGSASGTTSVSPTATTTYKLTCGEVVKEATVTIGSGDCPELTADLIGTVADGGKCIVNIYDFNVMKMQWSK